MKTVVLKIPGIVPPSFKNHKRAGINLATGKMTTYTRKDIKQRMKDLEDAILSSLYSSCLTVESATDSACRKQLRTLLSGLCDDSVREIPEAGFRAVPVDRGNEGLEITITLL